MTTLKEIMANVLNEPQFQGGLVTYMDDNKLYHIYTTLLSACRESIHRLLKLLMYVGYDAYINSIWLYRACRAEVIKQWTNW